MAWKKKLGWIGMVLLATIAVLSVAGYLVLGSPRFHRYLLAQIEKQASETTGAQVRIQNFALHLSHTLALQLSRKSR